MSDLSTSISIGPVRDLTSFDERLSASSSDNDLLAAIATGDKAAMALLLRRYVATMAVLANRIVLDPEQAREVTQEAFLRVWQNAGQWNPDGAAKFHTWLRRVVVNLAISHQRRQRPQVSLDMIGDMPSGQADGFANYAEAENMRIVKEGLEHLPERQRAAIALYYYDELPQAEAAAVLGMTPRAFDSLIVRARMNLKKYFNNTGFCHLEKSS